MGCHEMPYINHVAVPVEDVVGAVFFREDWVRRPPHSITADPGPCCLDTARKGAVALVQHPGKVAPAYQFSIGFDDLHAEQHGLALSLVEP